MNIRILDVGRMLDEIHYMEQAIFKEQGVDVISNCDEEGKQAFKILYFMRRVLEAGDKDEE